MNSKTEIEELTKSQKIAKILYEGIKRYLKAKESEAAKNSQKYFGKAVDFCREWRVNSEQKLDLLENKNDKRKSRRKEKR